MARYSRPFGTLITASSVEMPLFHRLDTSHLKRFFARMDFLEKHYRTIFGGNVISPAGHEWTFVHQWN
jgi:hypothetical protein